MVEKSIGMVKGYLLSISCPDWVLTEFLSIEKGIPASIKHSIPITHVAPAADEPVNDADKKAWTTSQNKIFWEMEDRPAREVADATGKTVGQVYMRRAYYRDKKKQKTDQNGQNLKKSPQSSKK